jgi:hypothetical protein
MMVAATSASGAAVSTFGTPAHAPTLAKAQTWSIDAAAPSPDGAQTARAIVRLTNDRYPLSLRHIRAKLQTAPPPVLRQRDPDAGETGPEACAAVEATAGQVIMSRARWSRAGGRWTQFWTQTRREAEGRRLARSLETLGAA